MVEALVGLAHFIHAVNSLPDLIRLVKEYPEMFEGLFILLLAGSLASILIRRSRKPQSLTIR